MHYGFPYKVLYTQYVHCIANHISNTALSLYLNSLSLTLSPGGAEVDQRHCVCLLIITDCSERLSTDRLHECKNIQTVSKSSRCDGKVTNRLVLQMNSLLHILLVDWCSLAVPWSITSYENLISMEHNFSRKKISLADCLKT